ncbi:hypothetical protein LINPERPRIM_LOCUS28057 [Linum perenne]
MHNVHRKKKAPAVAEPAVKKRVAVQFRCKTRPLLDVNGKIVQHPRRNTIRRDLMDANFHGLLDLQVDLINKELCVSTRHNNVKLATLKKSTEECQDGNAFSRMYILHTLGTLLVPGNSWKISLNYAKYLNEEFSLIGQLNWGKYVVDTLLMGLDDFQSKLSYPSGDFNFLVVSVKEFSYGTIMAQV